MRQNKAIDITFDFRSDTPPGRDPDALSPTLRRYHKLLWSKPLPSGAPFVLDDTTRGVYLHHVSGLGEFFLASDAVVPSFTRDVRLVDIANQIPREELDESSRIGYTIGGMMLFPGNRVDRKMTINGARGLPPKNQRPLRPDGGVRPPALPRRAQSAQRHPRALRRLLRAVRRLPGYVDFFLLKDMVTDDYSAVRFFMPFEDFTAAPLPASVDVYEVYMQLAVEFIEARNRRIDERSGADRPGAYLDP